MVLLDLLDQGTEEATESLKEAVIALTTLIEPGLIEQTFPHWIAEYNRLLAEHENNQSSVLPRSLPSGHSESPE